jgi:hypothetical protein
MLTLCTLVLLHQARLVLPHVASFLVGSWMLIFFTPWGAWPSLTPLPWADPHFPQVPGNAPLSCRAHDLFTNLNFSSHPWTSSILAYDSGRQLDICPTWHEHCSFGKTDSTKREPKYHENGTLHTQPFRAWTIFGEGPIPRMLQ